MTAVVILAVALAVGAVTALRSLDRYHTTLASVAAAPRVNGRPALFRDSRDEFVEFVLNVVPSNAPIRIVQPFKQSPPGAPASLGPSGRCGNEVAGAAYWLLVYWLIPRPSVCDAPDAWTIYFGVPVPPGPHVERFSPTLGVQPP